MTGMSGKILPYTPRPDMPVGVFDSGLGGLSTLRELIRLMPGEDFIYYGDHANSPYGTKDLQTVRDLSVSCADLLVGRRIKALVIACNTATSAAVNEIRARYPFIPVIGAEPAVKPAVTAFPGSDIIVMATERTLSERKFKDLCAGYRDRANIIPAPFPGLVEFVERGQTDTKELESFLSERLSHYLTPACRAIVLGCTHYPFVRGAIQKAAGEGITLFDGNVGIAKEVRRRLAGDLTLSGKEKGSVIFTGSGLTEKLRKLTLKLMEIE